MDLGPNDVSNVLEYVCSCVGVSHRNPRLRLIQGWVNPSFRHGVNEGT